MLTAPVTLSRPDVDHRGRLLMVPVIRPEGDPERPSAHVSLYAPSLATDPPRLAIMITPPRGIDTPVPISETILESPVSERARPRFEKGGDRSYPETRFPHTCA